MKTIIVIGLIVTGLINYGCKKDSDLSKLPCSAEVIGLNADCGVYQIKIIQGLNQVKSIAGSTPGDSIYIAINLSDELKINGLRIMLDIRKPNANELGVCTAMGPGYRWIFVTKAIRK